jgi:hypothetical protein
MKKPLQLSAFGTFFIFKYYIQAVLVAPIFLLEMSKAAESQKPEK